MTQILGSEKAEGIGQDDAPASSRGIVFGYRINRIKDKAGGGKSKAECGEENGRCQAHVDQKSETSSRILHLDTGKSSRHGVEIDMLLHAQNLTGSWEYGKLDV